jgi:hypothetical protein
LRGHEYDSHQDISQGELIVDEGGCGGRAVGQSPGFGHKEVSAEEGDQPDNREQSETHLPDLLKVMECGQRFG